MRKGDELARLRYKWDGATVELRITAKPKKGSTIVAYVERLPSADRIEVVRASWRTALDALKTSLS